MTKEKAIEIIRDIVECYIDINNRDLTSTERREVINLIDDIENEIVNER